MKSTYYYFVGGSLNGEKLLSPGSNVYNYVRGNQTEVYQLVHGIVIDYYKYSHTDLVLHIPESNKWGEVAP